MRPSPHSDAQETELINALAQLKTKKELHSFLRDLLTVNELKEFSKRFHIAKQLWLTEKSYLQIANEAQTSTTTVTRVANWLFKEGLNGYQTALKRLFPTKKSN